MPGTWTKVVSICSSRRTVAYAQCRSWADQGSAACSSWADHGSNQCSNWADQGSNQCSNWADQGSNQCSSWYEQNCHWYSPWNCIAGWFCQAWYWVAKWVCLAWYWVAKWVCLAWYWVAKWVCLAWYWIAKWVCLAWQWVFYVFCINAQGGPMFLLTDGTLLLNECESGYGTRRWWRLTPDSSGSYINGLWIRAADSNVARKYFASAVLADGRLLVCGGEYSDASGSNSQDDTARSEIFDPVANTWTEIAPPAGVTQIGDSACCLLPNGRFFLGNFNAVFTNIFDPGTGTWSAAQNKGDNCSEESWVLMRDGTIIVPQCSNSPNAEKYVIATNTWVAAGALPSSIVEAASLEIGPGLLLTDGQAFFVGANAGNTGLYTSGALPANAGSWAPGPAIPPRGRQSRGSKDGPAVLLPSGIVLFPAAPVDGSRNNYLSPSSWFEFDGTNINTASDAPNSNCPTYVGRMIVIPTGQAIWVREDDKDFYAYTETGTPQNSFRPTITTAPSILVPGTTVAISGTQFNGLSQAVGYGDDYAAATNYPLVRVRNSKSGRVQYCRTFNHTTTVAGLTTPSMGVATGATIVTTQVAVPGDLELGASELTVVANGIPSTPREVKVLLQRGNND
jgi:hypothetical protein